jgi:hypothetical protein
MTITTSEPASAKPPPTSRQINEALETLKRARVPAGQMTQLQIWNADRLVEAATGTQTNEELRSLFAGLETIRPPGSV